MTSYPSPIQLLKRHQLRPEASWGQHFLKSEAVIQAILTACRSKSGQRIVEIGAGLGALTQGLLATQAEVWAIERDRNMCHVLRQEFASFSNFVLYEANAVDFDYSKAAIDAEHPPIIVGNLPYHLTAPLLFTLVKHHRTTSSWVVMIQKEVAQRLCAAPGSRSYGGITVILSRLRKISKVCDVSPACFVPPPAVDSMVIRLDPLSQPRGEVVNEAEFHQLVRTSFQKRRKMLINSLSDLAPREVVYAWCQTAQVDPQTRPEQLAPEQFAALQRAREQSSLG